MIFQDGLVKFIKIYHTVKNDFQISFKIKDKI